MFNQPLEIRCEKRRIWLIVVQPPTAVGGYRERTVFGVDSAFFLVGTLTSSIPAVQEWLFSATRRFLMVMDAATNMPHIRHHDSINAGLPGEVICRNGAAGELIVKQIPFLDK